jgi:hypothetical protein
MCRKESILQTQASVESVTRRDKKRLRPVLEKRQKEGSLDTKKKIQLVVPSVQTGESVGSLSKGETPFRRGSIREQAFLFLKTPRTYDEFSAFCKRHGCSAQNLLRFFRKPLGVYFHEKNGRIQLR